MKILHVIPSLSSDLGGPSQVALNLVKALRDQSYDAEILTTNFGLDLPLYQRSDYLFDQTQGLSVPTWVVPFDRPPLKEFIFSKAAIAWLWKNLANYDVIDNHYLFSCLPTSAAIIARLQNIPYTVRTMGQLTDWALAQSRTKKQIYSYFLERQNLSRAAAIHCTTPAEAEDVRAYGINTPTVTLPLGVTPPIPIANARAKLCQAYGLNPEQPVVLFLSRLHYKKRPDLLLKSLGQLNAAGVDFQAILAGSGTSDYVNELQQLTATLHLQDRVLFPGLVTGVDKALLLQGADAFVLPSFSENFGIAVAEALVAGLPVVITSGIQISAEIKAAKAGLVVDGDVDAVANAIGQLLSQPTLRTELGQRGQALAESRYAWAKIAQSLAKTYMMITDGKHLPGDLADSSLCNSRLTPIKES